jgi:hypothetical protein
VEEGYLLALEGLQSYLISDPQLFPSLSNRSWKGFKFFTEALDAYDCYICSGDLADLHAAHLPSLRRPCSSPKNRPVRHHRGQSQDGWHGSIGQRSGSRAPKRPPAFAEIRPAISDTIRRVQLCKRDGATEDRPMNTRRLR